MLSFNRKKCICLLRLVVPFDDAGLLCHCPSHLGLSQQNTTDSVAETIWLSVLSLFRKLEVQDQGASVVGFC